MVIQSQRREGVVKRKYEKITWLTQWGTAFIPVEDCDICKAEYRNSRRRITTRIPKRAHHKACPRNLKNRGAIDTGGVTFISVEDCAICKATYLNSRGITTRIPKNAHHKVCSRNLKNRGAYISNGMLILPDDGNSNGMLNLPDDDSSNGMLNLPDDDSSNGVLNLPDLPDDDSSNGVLNLPDLPDDDSSNGMLNLPVVPAAPSYFMQLVPAASPYFMQLVPTALPCLMHLVPAGPPFFIQPPLTTACLFPPIPPAVLAVGGWMPRPHDCCYKYGVGDYYCATYAGYLRRKNSGERILGKPPHHSSCPVRSNTPYH
jgi:hypothetical protein